MTSVTNTFRVLFTLLNQNGGHDGEAIYTHCYVINKNVKCKYFFIERDASLRAISDRRHVLLQKFESVQAENIELKRQLKVVQKRLKDLYERDSQPGK